MKKIRKFLLGILFAANLFIPHGCSCAGKGNDTTGSNPVVPAISFRASGAPANNSVYIEAISSNADEITLGVKVKGGTDVYGTSLEIVYDQDKLFYDTYSAEGNYLGVSPGDCYAKLYQKQGVLLVGIFKTGNVPGTDGDGLLLTLNFKALKAQVNTPIEFNTLHCVLKSSNKNNDNISGTNWLGGSLSYE
ncbi:MAG: cohesin domain-containing protein [bacterium]|nr:cohesin domain-containing protein [bacterium]